MRNGCLRVCSGHARGRARPHCVCLLIRGKSWCLQKGCQSGSRGRRCRCHTRLTGAWGLSAFVILQNVLVLTLGTHHWVVNWGARRRAPWNRLLGMLAISFGLFPVWRVGGIDGWVAVSDCSTTGSAWCNPRVVAGAACWKIFRFAWFYAVW